MTTFHPRALRNPNDQSHWRGTRRPYDRIVTIRRSRLARFLATLHVWLNTPID